jgi:hypothetical protein
LEETYVDESDEVDEGLLSEGGELVFDLKDGGTSSASSLTGGDGR